MREYDQRQQSKLTPMQQEIENINKWKMQIFYASDWIVNGLFADNKKTGERVLVSRFDESEVNGIILTQSNGTMVI